MRPLPDEWFPSYPSEGWILDEDRALRDHLKGVVVSDYSQERRPVEVWFGHPDQELREQKFPYITVDLVQIQEALERVHRGNLWIKDPPAWWGLPPLTGHQIGYLLEMPTPIDLDYQISTWSRNPRHDRQILNQLLNSRRLMPRGGLLFTADKKDRRLDLLGHVKRDSMEEGKKLFNNVFRVRVSSEVPWGGALDGSGSGSFLPWGVTTSVHIGILGKLRDLGISIDHQTVRLGTVLGIDMARRRADLDLDGQTANGVPVSIISVELKVDDVVAVVMHPTTGDPQSLADHHLLVLGLENRPTQ